MRRIFAISIVATTLKTIERIPGSVATIDEKTLETSRVFTFTEALRTTFFVTCKNLLDTTFIVDRARGILPSSPRLLLGGLKFRF